MNTPKKTQHLGPIQCYRNLGMAVARHSIGDFAKAYKAGNEENQQTIIKELRSPWMEFISNGWSIQIADKLEKDPKTIIDNYNAEILEQKRSERKQARELHEELLMEQQATM